MHFHAETVRVGGDGAVGDHDFADPVLGSDVAGEDRVDAVERSGVEHDARAVALFLGRLKHEHDRAGRRVGGEARRRPEHHRHVGVVTAGVHAARYCRGERQAGALGAGQCVHFRPHGNARAGARPREAPDDAPALASVVVRDAEAVELGHDGSRRLDLLVGELRPEMERSAQLPHARDCRSRLGRKGGAGIECHSGSILRVRAARRAGQARRSCGRVSTAARSASSWVWPSAMTSNLPNPARGPTL